MPNKVNADLTEKFPFGFGCYAGKSSLCIESGKNRIIFASSTQNVSRTSCSSQSSMIGLINSETLCRMVKYHVTLDKVKNRANSISKDY